MNTIARRSYILQVKDMEFAGAILAGGKASRFGGIAKGLLNHPSGQTFVEYLLGEFRLAGITRTAICFGNECAYAPHGAHLLPDNSPSCGPLGGIEAAIAYFELLADAAVFLPCDLPGISAGEILRLTVEYCRSGRPAVFAETAGFVRHPLCSVVHIGALNDVRAAIAGGRLSAREFMDSIGAAPVFFENEVAFKDVDTPREYSEIAGFKCARKGVTE